MANHSLSTLDRSLLTLLGSQTVNLQRKKKRATEEATVNIAALNTAAQEEENQADKKIEGLPDID